MEFGWDEAKRQSNLVKHGIDFRDVRSVFDGRPIVSTRSPYAVEGRYLTTSILEGRFVTVVWTRRNSDIGIISARRARDAEKERIVRYTAEELDEMLRRGESQTDWARVDALTEEELEASIDDEEEGEFDWSTTMIGLPPPKQQLTVRFDRDIVDWFQAQGAGYQTRMNAVLRSFVEAQKKQAIAASNRRESA